MMNKTFKCFSLVFFCACLLASAGHAAEPDSRESADGLFRQAKYADAKALYIQVYSKRDTINNTPDQKSLNVYVLLQIGRCCRHLGQFAEARQWVAKVAVLYPNDKEMCAEAQYECGIAYRREGQGDQAIQAFEKVISDYPLERRVGAYALIEIAKINSRSHNYPAAVESLRRLLKDYSKKNVVRKQAQVMLVAALGDALRIDDALALLDEMLTGNSYPGHERGDLLVMKAEIQLRASRYADCRETCQKILTEFPLGSTLVASAKLALLQALCEDGSDPHKALALIDELSKQADAYRNPSRNPSIKANLALWKGQAYWVIGDYANAEKCFTKMLTDFKDQPQAVSDAYLHRARLRATSMKSYDDAEKDIAHIPVAYLRHLAQGELHMGRKEYTDAAKDFEQVVADPPSVGASYTERVAALRGMKKCYTALGDTTKADDARSRLAELEPKPKQK